MSVQEALQLGAYDLRRSYNKNLAIAFVIALFFHMFLLGGKSVVDIVFGGSGSGDGGEKLVAAGPVTLDDFTDELENEEIADVDVVPPPPPMSATLDVGTGSEGRMGLLEATSDDLSDLPDIAGIDEQEFASTIGGGSGGVAMEEFEMDLPENLDIGQEKAQQFKEKEYGMDEFVEGATLPSYNRAELNRLLDYPAIARENGIEGRVVVSVQVSKTGKPLQVKIRRSDNDIFNDSAVEAVRKLRFSPAIQNGHPIKLWVTFNVTFKLE